MSSEKERPDTGNRETVNGPTVSESHGPLGVPAGYGYGTHLPALAHYCLRTSGPVLELGMGIFSTPTLHAWCRSRQTVESGRLLVSAEEDAAWRREFACFEADWHPIFSDYDFARDSREHWDVVLIDHAKDRRQADLLALADRATYLIVHDANCPKVYGYDFSGFKYSRLWGELSPTTMVVSNEVQP